MGTLLHNMGKLEEARPLLEEDLQASKETLGDRHPDMLISIGYLVVLLRATGDLAEAEAVSPGHIFGESGLFFLRMNQRPSGVAQAMPWFPGTGNRPAVPLDPLAGTHSAAEQNANR